MTDLFVANTSSGARKKYIGAQAVVDSTGTCDILFPAASVATYQTGSVTVYDSPTVATWTLYINSLPQDVTTGVSTVRSAQIGPNDTLEIKATNLLGYTGQTFHAMFVCIESPADNTDLIVPGHDNIFPPAQSNLLYITPGLTGSIALPQGQSFTTPFLPTAGYGSIFVYVIGLNAVNTQYQVAWYTNTLVPTGGNVTTWNKGGTGQTNPCATKAIMPVLGSFVTITANNNFTATGANSIVIQVVGIPPGESFLIPPVGLILQNGLTVPASGTSTNINVFQDIVPGKYHLWAQMNGGSGNQMNLQIQEWSPSIGWVIVEILTFAGPQISNQFDLCFEGHDIRAFASNPSTVAGALYTSLRGPY